MNYLDILLAIPLLWALYRGFTKGLIIEVASLAALILGVFGAIKFSWYTSELLVEKLEWTTRYLHLVSFALTFLAIVIGVHLLARIIDQLVKAIALGWINRILGVFFGLIKMAFILSVILVILNVIDRTASFIPQEDKERSVLYEPLSRFAPAIFPYLNFEFINPNLMEPLKKQDSSVAV